ncbi:MAG: hypothetical protein P1P64_01935 [Treponemataceae bacterium]
MLPIYFFTVLFFIAIGFLLAFLESNKISSAAYKTSEDFFTSKSFSLICAIVAIILAVLKIFVPVKSGTGTIYLIDDLIPVLVCLILVAIFSYRYFLAIGQSFASMEFLGLVNQYSVIVGYTSIIVGILHLLFAQMILF